MNDIKASSEQHLLAKKERQQLEREQNAARSEAIRRAKAEAKAQAQREEEERIQKYSILISAEYISNFRGLIV